MGDALVVEVAPFAVADGVPEATLLEASERLERELLSSTDGYLGRILARLDARQWVDIVLWRSQRHADAAMQRVAESAACSACFGCMVGASTAEPGQGVVHYRAVRTYGTLAA